MPHVIHLSQKLDLSHPRYIRFYGIFQAIILLSLFLLWTTRTYIQTHLLLALHNYRHDSVHISRDINETITILIVFCLAAWLIGKRLS